MSTAPAADTTPSKYGSDPRAATEEQVVADASFVIAPGYVTPLKTIPQLQAALDAAGADALVVLKFMRDGCTACAGTREEFESTAKEYGSLGQFYEVNYDEAKDFCRKAKVKFVPSGQIYANGALEAALPMGKKTWSDFRKRLDEAKAALGS